MHRILLHNIGPRLMSNYNTLEEIMALPRETPLSFDGMYPAVYEHRHLLKEFKDIIIFPCGDHVGKDTSFDVGQPLTNFATWEQIVETVMVTGAKLGWHSNTHRNLCLLSDDEVKSELVRKLEVDGFVLRFDYFAYPYGECDDRVVKLVEEAGYHEAWSVFKGDNSRFQRLRRYLNW